jgi:hypothetical protein
MPLETGTQSVIETPFDAADGKGVLRLRLCFAFAKRNPRSG